MEEVALKHKLNPQEVEMVSSFLEFYQFAAESCPKDYHSFEDFFSQRVTNNSSLALDEKNILSGTPEALEIMKYFYEEENN